MRWRLSAWSALLFCAVIGAASCGGGGGGGSSGGGGGGGTSPPPPPPGGTVPPVPPPVIGSGAGPASVFELGGLPTGYALVWSDEFDGAGAPNSTRWAYESERGTTGVGNGDGWGNNELQYYTDNRRDNARVENGNLVIEARREDFLGKRYTSARLVTNGKQSWRYGFFEIRAKPACGRGVWPAIWTLGSPRPPYTLTSWPYDGEIDIMERFGFDTSNAGLSEIIVSAHTGAHNPLPNGNVRSVAVPTADLCTSFHRYQLTWTAQRLTIGVDDRNYFSYLNDGSGKYEWPFDSPQYLIMNVAVGGNWFAGGTVDDGVFPVRMEVDYVRVYQAP